MKGEETRAFIGSHNSDRSPVNVVANTAVTFNRNSAFFKPFWSLDATLVLQEFKEGPYIGGTQQAQLVIALHELAHLLHDDPAVPGDPPPPVSTLRVPDYRLDGVSQQASGQNTDVIVQKCRVMIERF